MEVCEREEKWSHTVVQEINLYYRNIGLLDNVAEQQAEQEPPSDSPEVVKVD